jgi:hypothetical protein
MKYDLTLPLDRERFAAKANALLQKGAFVELVDKSGRTRAQNSYGHLLIGVVAMETGVTLDYCKEYYFKRLVNPDIFIRRVADPLMGEVDTIRSTKELSVKETSLAIDRFKRWCYEQGFCIPSVDDDAILKDIEREMGRMENYIGV